MRKEDQWEFKGLLRRNILLGSVLAASTGGLAAPHYIGENSPPFKFNLGAGLTTYKSTAVDSNNTGIAFGYDMSFWGGSNNKLGMEMRYDTLTTSFAYDPPGPKSSIATSFTSFLVRYRLSYFYLGLVFDQAQLGITKKDVQWVDAMALGYGGNFGFAFPIGKSTSFSFDLLTASDSNVKEAPVNHNKTTPVVAIGSRMDLQLTVTMAITKRWLDAIIGYHIRQQALSVAGKSYSELELTTWVGLGMNYDI